MGSGASKTASKTVRTFPARAPGSVPPPPTRAAARPSPAPKENRKASYSKDEAIRSDSVDPQLPESMNPAFSSRLRQMGVAQPNPTYSNTSTVSQIPPQQKSQTSQTPPSPSYPSPSRNTTLSALDARRRLEQEAEEEFSNMGFSGNQGRQHLNSGMIRDILVMRERGASPADIEHRFNLRSDVLQRLGPRGIIEPLGGNAKSRSD